VDSNAIALDLHGFAADDPITFRAEAGGSLPAPLEAGVTYYAIPVTDGAFSVAAAASGAAIDLTTAGERVLVIGRLPLAAACAWASRLIDDMCPAHLVPFTEPVPEIVRMTAAELAAGKVLAISGNASESLSAIVDAAAKRLERWAKGVPISGANATAPVQLAASASLPYRDPRGWNRFGGL